jgi:hypothetical protein
MDDNILPLCLTSPVIGVLARRIRDGRRVSGNNLVPANVVATGNAGDRP